MHFHQSCVASRASPHCLGSHLATPSKLWLVSNTCVCVCVRAHVCECGSSVWQCVSCHDVVCTAHCSHTKLYLPRYKSLGSEAKKVNKKGKIWRTGMECGCTCVIMCCVGFMQRCIIFLNYPATNRWKLFRQKQFCWYLDSRGSGCWVYKLFFFFFYVLFSWLAHWKEFLCLPASPAV